MDNLLEKYNLKYEDLSKDEKETLNTWMAALQQGALSIEKIRDFISSMKKAVEQELCSMGHESKQDIFLKARLRNLMLLESMLTTPDNAKKQMESAVAGIASALG